MRQAHSKIQHMITEMLQPNAWRTSMAAAKDMVMYSKGLLVIIVITTTLLFRHFHIFTLS